MLRRSSAAIPGVCRNAWRFPALQPLGNGVARIQAGHFDGEFLSKWAANLGVVALLSRICP